MREFAATQAFYGRWARLYDALATAPGVGSWRVAAADALDLSPGDTVVEMGCGTGANLPYLRDRVGAEGQVVGVDLTREMLDRARERVAEAGWENVDLVRADARRPPIAGPVDAILGAFVVGMFEEPAGVVGGWVELLDEDGSVALLNATRSPSRLAAPLNLAFRGFVALSSPGGGSGGGQSGTEVLEERIAAATEALAAGTATSDERRLAGGFVTLRWGRGCGGELGVG